MAKTISKKQISKAVNTVTPYTGNPITTFLDKIVNFKFNKKVYIFLIIAGLVLLAINKKEWLIAALVNGQPISNIDLQMRLNQQFRSQTINQMVNEKIIMDEAAKNNAVPAEGEINTKIAEIETQVGGAQAFDALLAQQGQNRNTIRPQIIIPLALEKLYGKEATVSAQEIDEFIETNKELIRATDSAGQRNEAADTLKQQKLSQISSQKFQELKQKTKVQIF